MTSCNAIGCRVTTSRLFCGPHFRLLSKEDRDRLKLAGYSGQAVLDAIEVIARREGKEPSQMEWLKLQERYGS
jgi:hypothetical protein